MEFTVNTIAKIITFKGRVNINDLINELADLGIDFKDYSIEGEPYTFINPITSKSYNPFEITPWIVPNQPYNPYPTTNPTEPFVWCHVCHT